MDVKKLTDRYNQKRTAAEGKISKEKAKLLGRLKELEAEEKRWEELTPAQRMATFLHEKLCLFNHTDGCGWYYREFDWEDSTHRDYIIKAERLLRTFTEEQIYAFMEAIYPPQP